MFCAIRCGSCRRVTHRRYVFDSSSANGTLTGSVWTQRTPLGVGPAPGTGSPTITSADYGFCGLEAISGYFDNLASARIQVAPSGYFELVTSQAAYARTAGFSPPTASARCRRLTDFTGLPPNSQATGKINQVSDTSLPFAPSTTSSVGAAPAHIWQGFTGPLSSGSGGTLASYRQGWADLGAFSSSSKGCFQPYSGALCATGSNQNLLVLASPYVGTTNTMTTFSYQAGYSPTRTWTYHPQANQALEAMGSLRVPLPHPISASSQASIPARLEGTAALDFQSFLKRRFHLHPFPRYLNIDFAQQRRLNLRCTDGSNAYPSRSSGRCNALVARLPNTPPGHGRRAGCGGGYSRRRRDVYAFGR